LISCGKQLNNPRPVRIKQLPVNSVCICSATALSEIVRNEERLIMAKNVKPYKEPTHDEIAAFAQRIYESEGRPQGKALAHWLKAEAQLIAEHKAQAGQLPVQNPAKAVIEPPRAQNSGWQPPAKQTLHRN
jgi:hypothetical protein